MRLRARVRPPAGTRDGLTPKTITAAAAAGAEESRELAVTGASCASSSLPMPDNLSLILLRIPGRSTGTCATGGGGTGACTGGNNPTVGDRIPHLPPIAGPADRRRKHRHHRHGREHHRYDESRPTANDEGFYSSEASSKTILTSADIDCAKHGC